MDKRPLKGTAVHAPPPWMHPSLPYGLNPGPAGGQISLNQPVRPSRDKQVFREIKTKTTITESLNEIRLVNNVLPRRGTKIYNVGERGSGIRPQGPIQDFNQIRKKCLDEGKLFEDPDFPANMSSLFYDQKPNHRKIEWKRPSEICRNSSPEFIAKGISRFDVQQGELGNCWFAAALANISFNEKNVSRLVPLDQDFGDQYAGVFHFRFWRFGRWVDVVVDDRLPTVYGQLIYLRSNDKNEFWSSLLEKAYAKLHGSYQALDCGRTSEAMVDLTGGISEVYHLEEINGKDEADKIFRIMSKGCARSSVMACSIKADKLVRELRTSNGLIKGHAYSITKVASVMTRGNRIKLIRIRNPWGNELEWTGSWSDNSREWDSITQEERKRLGLTFENDGEFWMSFDDFIKYFSDLEICHMNPESMDDERERNELTKWVMNTIDGKWIPGISSSGGRTYNDMFKGNPAFTITLDKPDEDDEENKCTVIVSLMQKNRRTWMKMGSGNLFIGVYIYEERKENNFITAKDKFRLKTAPTFRNSREVTTRIKLPPGNYCIVPSILEQNDKIPSSHKGSYDASTEGEFLLRVYSETKNDIQEYDKDITIAGDSKDMFRLDVKKDDEQIMRRFTIIAGKDQEVGWKNVKKLLEEVIIGENFSEDVCRSMIAMMDKDYSGKLGYWEFKCLLRITRMWKEVFKLYDKDKSLTLDTHELREALNSAGFKINNHILGILVYRYAGYNGKMTFDSFLMCVVRLKGMIDKYNERIQPLCPGFNLQEWLEITLYS